jgi:hypothetical protein
VVEPFLGKVKIKVKISNYIMNELNVKSNSRLFILNIAKSTVKEIFKPNNLMGLPFTFCIMGLQVFKNSKRP